MGKKPPAAAPPAPARWLSTNQAWRLVYAAIGGPTWETFVQWVKPSGRLSLCPPDFPRPFRVPGRHGHVWDRDEIESWIERNGPAAAKAARDARSGPEGGAC